MDGCERFELDMIDYLDGTLDEKRLHAFMEHINGCPACSHRLEMMRVLMAETSELSAQLPEGLHEQIMAGVRREKKGGRLLRFASRRVVATAAAVAILVCAASVYAAARLRGSKSADCADMELMAVNNQSAAAFDMKSGGSAANTADAGDLDGTAYSYTTENEGSENDDAAPAEYWENAEETEEQDKDEQSASPETLFSNIPEDTRYAAVVVMDAETVPEVLEEYVLLTETGTKTNENGNEVLYIIVPADRLDEIVKLCRTEEIKLEQFDMENPAPDVGIIDESAEDTLVILQITK